MKKVLLFFACGFCILQSDAQNKTYWKSLKESELSKAQDIWGRQHKPAAYRLFHLDEPILRNELLAAPSEKDMRANKNGKIINVPDAAGKIQQFNIAETILMAPALAGKYTGIKTYIGKGIDDPSAIIRFSVTTSGFHAIITAAGKETFYINAIDKNNKVYAVNARNDNDAANAFKCSLDESILKRDPSTSKATKIIGNADDGTLREYRLALCVNGEFSQFFLDGSEPDTAAMKAKVMDAMIVCLERANAIFERDFGVRMIFVNNEDTLIYIDPATDPWKTKSSNSWNTETQQVIDARIGAANYDIGHLLGKVPTFNDNNGNAGCIGCVCDNTQKGRGFTAYNDPSLTDYLVIDYWTHEMGHQFGANHTFTYINEETGANIEPGSGSTIMGYAGITGAFDVQAHSDDLFSTVSIAQTANYIKSAAGSCAVATVNGNAAPFIYAGPDRTIPKGTPFMLTGTATDANPEDAMSYIWEQIDIYQKTSYPVPRATSLSGPIFRTYNYVNEPVRYFPDLAYILDGSMGGEWELLPSVGRQLNFRFTARDNHIGGGNNKSGKLRMLVDSSSGPFQITVQNAPSVETWNIGHIKTITWDVNNTNVAPVSCSTVNILLSTDGGLNFNTVLTSATANDGTEDIVVPNKNTTKARIKIEAADNVFFTISNKDFAIETILPVTWLSFTAQKLNNASVLVKWSTTNELNNKFYMVERSSDERNFITIGQVTAGNNPANVQEYNFTDYKALGGANYYRLKQVDADGHSSYSAIAKIILPEESISWSVQPNPVKTVASFYARKNMSDVSIVLADASGRIVYKTQKQKITAGEQVLIPVANLAKGVYLIKVKRGESTRSEKLVID
ncbi:N/A [soil metagenome]